MLPFSTNELGLDLTHKITLELPNKYKIIFNNDGTSKSYEYTEFKHLVKDEPKPKREANTNFWWITKPYSVCSYNPINNSWEHEPYQSNYQSYLFIYNTQKGYFKYLGIATKEELLASHPDVGTVVYCEEDNNTYVMLSNGWEKVTLHYFTNGYWEEPAKIEEIVDNKPTFHEESYWEYVEVKNG